MTPTTHPDETQLFAYVEGEPTDGDVAGHVHECPVCAGRVAELVAGRDALRAAPILQLPDRRSRDILEHLERLGDERRERVRRLRTGGWWMWSPKRLVAVVTPIVAVLTVVAVFASTNGTGDDQAGEQAAVATTTAADAAGGEESAALSAPAPVRSVEGTPGQVARYLQQLGLDAEVVDGRVDVHGATPEQVRQALEGVDDGAVPVVIVP